MVRKIRVVLKPHEKEKLINAATEILKKTTYISSTNLLREAQNIALPPNRHRSIQTNISRKLLLEAKKKLNIPVPVPSSSRELLHKTIDSIFSQQEKLLKEVYEIKKTIMQFESLLTKILGDLNDYKKPVPLKEPIPLKESVPLKEPKIRIVIIGPLANQANIIKDKIKDLATLSFIENEKHFNFSSIKNYNYAIVTRHTKHSQEEQVISILGRERVVRLTTSGIDKITKAITELVVLPKNVPAYSILNK